MLKGKKSRLYYLPLGTKVYFKSDSGDDITAEVLSVNISTNDVVHYECVDPRTHIFYTVQSTKIYVDEAIYAKNSENPNFNTKTHLKKISVYCLAVPFETPFVYFELNNLTYVDDSGIYTEKVESVQIKHCSLTTNVGVNANIALRYNGKYLENNIFDTPQKALKHAASIVNRVRKELKDSDKG